MKRVMIQVNLITNLLPVDTDRCRFSEIVSFDEVSIISVDYAFSLLT
jgi:hypothetical protein